MGCGEGVQAWVVPQFPRCSLGCVCEGPADLSWSVRCLMQGGPGAETRIA